MYNKPISYYYNNVYIKHLKSTVSSFNLLLPYNAPGTYDYNLRYNQDWYALNEQDEYVSYSVYPPAGFPFGDDIFSNLYVSY